MEIRVADCPLGAKCEEVKNVDGRQIMYRCPWYVMLRGNDVNTGAEVDHWGCAIAWMPTLTINTANEARKNVAATESFRNEVTSRNAVRLASRQEEKQICE
jgi:hypothetical protein